MQMRMFWGCDFSSTLLNQKEIELLCEVPALWPPDYVPLDATMTSWNTAVESVVSCIIGN